jgi:hypothetical protein
VVDKVALDQAFLLVGYIGCLLPNIFPLIFHTHLLPPVKYGWAENPEHYRNFDIQLALKSIPSLGFTRAKG